MISITTQQRQFELRISLSLERVERVWDVMVSLFSFKQVREIERQKQEMLRNAGFSYWRI